MQSKEQIIREFMVQRGRKGAKVRAAKLSPERRRDIARKAAQARWRGSEKVA